jgi:hypothetical protein
MKVCISDNVNRLVLLHSEVQEIEILGVDKNLALLNPQRANIPEELAFHLG